MNRLLMLFLSLATWASGQALNLQSLDRLASRAKETVNVTLDGSLLQLAAKFLDSDDADQAQVRKLVTNLKGIYVRSFEFKESGVYSKADLEGLRAQVRGARWSRIVDVQSAQDAETAEIYLQADNKVVNGIVLFVANPKELTVVQILGPVDLDGISRLSGKMGIPNLKLQATPRQKRD